MEIKVGVGYTGKADRYSTGKSKRLKKKFTFIDIGKEFMKRFSLQAEERLSLSKVKNLLFGEDGNSWITSGIKDYFPTATCLLCFYHPFKKRMSRKKERRTEGNKRSTFI